MIKIKVAFWKGPLLSSQF